MKRRPAGKGQRSAKRGSTLLMRRRRASPAAGVYTPQKQCTNPASRHELDARTVAAKSKVKLEDILAWKHGINVVRKQVKSKLVTAPKHCPFCSGTKITSLSAAVRGLGWRCKTKGCKKRILVSHVSKVFHGGRGGVNLRLQVAILWCAVWRVQQWLVPAIVRGANRNAVDTMCNAWRETLSKFMEEQQEFIKFGNFPNSTELAEEIETDEFVVRKETGDDIDGHPVVSWQEFVNMKRRGDRKSLYVSRRDPSQSVSAVNSKGFAVPPPYTKEEWKPLRDRRFKPGASGINHTDGLPAYTAQPPGWQGDKVSHGRSKTKGGPEFVGKRRHTSQDGRVHATVGGTQALDSIGGHLKHNVGQVNARFPGRVSERIREGQWHHWVKAEDKWEAAAVVLR